MGRIGDVRQMQPWFRYLLYLFGIKLFSFYSSLGMISSQIRKSSMSLTNPS